MHTQRADTVLLKDKTVIHDASDSRQHLLRSKISG